jgi:hypothetical protein
VAQCARISALLHRACPGATVHHIWRGADRAWGGRRTAVDALGEFLRTISGVRGPCEPRWRPRVPAVLESKATPRGPRGLYGFSSGYLAALVRWAWAGARPHSHRRDFCALAGDLHGRAVQHSNKIFMFKCWRLLLMLLRLLLLLLRPPRALASKSENLETHLWPVGGLTLLVSATILPP